ncbi:MAG: hypothetical protein ACTTIZ_00940 [Treponema sp.]
MAIETLKTLRRSIEDLIKAYQRLAGTEIKGTEWDKIKELEEKLKGVKEVVDITDFVSGNPSISRIDITNSSIESIQGKSSPTIPFIVIANNLNLFENGKKYEIIADFNILSAITPPYVQINLKNDTSNTYIYKSKEVPITERKVTAEFTYKERAGEVIKIVFEAGGNIDCEVEWKNIKIYRLETEYTEEQKKVDLRVLDEHVETARAYINAIRNKNGNITVPEAKEKDDAVNLQLLHDRVTIAINKLKEELIEALEKEKTERKVADETFIKVDELSDVINKSDFGIGFRNKDGYINLESRILLFGRKNLLVKTMLPIYFDINARVDELKNKSGVTIEAVKKEAKIIVEKYLIDLFKNGYIQWPGMPNPSEIFYFPGYRWAEVNYNGCFFRAKGGNAFPFDGGEQYDAIRNIWGYFSGSELFNNYESIECEGAFSMGKFTTPNADGSYTSRGSGKINFNASRVVPTANENRPRNRTIIIWKLEKI